MSRLRLRIAERLLEAQHTAAILTTFNEVDMSAAMALRARYKEAYQQRHGIALGYMSIFTKACIEALKAYPAVNAELNGDEIVYKRYYDIGVAVGTERGLVVPVVREADRKSFIEIELEIAELARKARENKLSLEELSGGTFSISNGGIYGSMLSTPILNPPQVGILGMHNIVKRAVVVKDQVEVRPMMYVALSYDHRIIDGREAVQFLLRVKECVEDPARILIGI
jgi:2-oxoglutarate dehydrogenase E2 component (dihydrolipoamide succinyltransferase)